MKYAVLAKNFASSACKAAVTAVTITYCIY